MIGTHSYVCGSRERHSELTEEMHIPLRPIPKEDTRPILVSIHWATDGNWLTKQLDIWKVTQLNLPLQESVNASVSVERMMRFELISLLPETESRLLVKFNNNNNNNERISRAFFHVKHAQLR